MASYFTSGLQEFRKHDEILIFQDTFRKLRLFFYVLSSEEHSLSVVENNIWTAFKRRREASLQSEGVG